jgi:hypothetical protein
MNSEKDKLQLVQDCIIFYLRTGISKFADNYKDFYVEIKVIDYNEEKKNV